jgi:hypothetical protein
MKRNKNKIFPELRNVSGDNNSNPSSSLPNFPLLLKAAKLPGKRELKDCLGT